MNFEFIPHSHWKYGFAVAVLLMLLSAVLPYWYFKRKDWL
jgi:magnesium transporter